MALNDVTFIKGQGGLGRPLDGEDHISGLVYYVPSGKPLPSGFSDANVKAVFSLEEAEALGINDNCALETVATGGTVQITTAAIGSTIEVKVNSLSLAKTTMTTAVASTEATALKDAINAGTSVHGYSATVASDTVSLVAPAKTGVGIHGTALSKVTTGTAAASVNPFSGGVADPYVVLWYQISEYFRVQPKGVLYVGIYTEPSSTWTFDEVKNIQTSFADGKIRQLGVFTTKDFVTTGSQLSALHGKANDLSVSDKKPLSILFASNLYKVSDSSTYVQLSELPDLSASTYSYVSMIIGQDGGSKGNELFVYSGKSVACLGAALGAVSRSKVSENIGWVKNFNMAEGELDVVAFADGTPYRQVAESELSGLNDKHYVFLRKHVGINGSYFNDSHTATSESSDYATIENNRTIDKAIRNIRTFLIPELNGPLFVDPTTGNLSEDTSAYFQNLAGRPLEQMQRDQELSGFQVIVNPKQDVLSTSKLAVVVKLVPVGVARQIQVNIGFTVKIS